MSITSGARRLLIAALWGGVWLGLLGAGGCGQKTPEEQDGHGQAAGELAAKMVPKIPEATMDSLRLKKKRYEITRDAYWEDRGGVLENSYLELWYPPGPVTVTHGMQVFEQIAIARSQCRSFFGLEPARKLKVVCTPEMEDYQKQTGRDWWQYSKIEKDQITFQPVYILHQRHLDEIAPRHEYFEWAIGRLSDGRAPRWLEEGLSSFLSGESAVLTNQLTEFRKEKLAMTIEEIEKQLAAENDRKLTRIACYHAYRMVETLILKKGESRLRELVLRLGEDLEIDQACLLVFQKPLAGVLAEATNYQIPDMP